MEIIAVQLVAIVFSIFMIYFTYLAYRRQHFEIYSLVIWLTIFGGLIVFTVFPGFFIPVIAFLEIARLFDFFLIVGIFFLIVISYVNFMNLQKLKKKLEKVVQNKALEEDKKD